MKHDEECPTCGCGTGSIEADEYERRLAALEAENATLRRMARAWHRSARGWRGRAHRWSVNLAKELLKGRAA